MLSGILSVAAIFASGGWSSAEARAEDEAAQDGRRDVEREASREEIRAFLEELAERTSATRTLRVRFRQEKRLRLLRRPRVSTGELVFARGRLAIDVRGREGELESRLVSGDGETRILYPSLRRLEVLPAAPEGDGGERPNGREGWAEDASRVIFRGDWERLERSYDLRWLRTSAARDEDGGGGGGGGGEGARSRLVLVPRIRGEAHGSDSPSPADSADARIEIAFRGHQVGEYWQRDRRGNEVRITIEEWSVDEPIDDERFRLDLPPGTEVIRLSGRGGSVSGDVGSGGRGAGASSEGGG